MDIRKADIKDLKRIIELGAMLQEDSKIFEHNLLFDIEDSYKHYKKELGNQNAQIIIALVNGHIVGYQYSYIKTLDYLVDHNKECTFEALYVLPDFRGQGIGRQLVEKAKKWAIIEKNVNRLKAHIYSGNISSEKLHLKDGFRAYNTEYLYETNNNQ